VNTRIQRVIVIASLASVGGSFAACGSSSGGGNGGAGDAGGSSSGAASSSGGSSSGSSTVAASSSGSSSGTATGDAGPDEAICSSACTALVGCGVTEPASCSTDCLAKTVFITCAAGAGGDCNALALCAFEQSASTSCSSGAGIPSGTGSCDDLHMCKAGCFTSSTPATCTCACDTALSSGKAINALIDDSCAESLCATDCAPGAAAAECGDCESAHCASQVSQCTSH
jgi:hypothetical protein